jgi:hypothetical protein
LLKESNLNSVDRHIITPEEKKEKIGGIYVYEITLI